MDCMPFQWVVGCKVLWTKCFGIFNQEHKNLGLGLFANISGPSFNLISITICFHLIL